MTVAEVFIDGTLAAESYGETGAGIASGPRVGPNTLSEILCDGKIRVIVTDGLHPVAYSDLGEAIPPATRSYVLWRDQGQCSIEGCREPLPAPTPPHLTTSLGRQPRLGQPDHPLLVSPSCRHPPDGIPDRPRQSHPPATAHPPHNTGPPAGWTKTMIGNNSEHPSIRNQR